MSTDTVDDLHAAEDMIGVAEAYLRQAVERVHLAHAREPIESCHHEWCAEGLRAIADVAGYCRPSCELNENTGRWVCPSACGCPADHTPGHFGARDSDEEG